MEEELFGIGAVVERTGLSAPGIRMWEKRYGVVEPRRTETNRRLYTVEDVERLRLLKLLTDRGHAIRTIADLDLAQLRKRFGEPGVARGGVQTRVREGKRSRLMVVGTALESIVRDKDLFEAEVVAQFEDLAAVEAAGDLGAVDLLVVSTETLFPEMVTTVREVVSKTNAARTVLIYRFASTKTATALAKAIEGLSLLRSPLNNNQLRRECLVQLNTLRGEGFASQIVFPGPVPERLYEAEQLSRLTRVSSAVECECPQHLAGLLQSLTAFEKYSEECEDRNPDDALLHAFLHRTTAQIRRTLEEALRHLILTEGIELD